MTIEDRLQKIQDAQKEFQLLLEKPIESIVLKDKCFLAEEYILKLIEEAIEVRREFPSALNPWSKHEKIADPEKICNEMTDVFLFVVNLLLVWNIDIVEFLTRVEKTQFENFKSLKQKKLKVLNDTILQIPGYTTGIGFGSVFPQYFIVGMNPSQTIKHGDSVWNGNDPNHGSNKILLPVLRNLGIIDNCYFTNLVKSTTPQNIEPTKKEVEFWFSYLMEEVELLRQYNPNMKIVGLGKFVENNLPVDISIPHPAYVLRGGMSIEDYENLIKEWIK